MNTGTATYAAHGDDARVRDFLADSLALWRVAGIVEEGELPIVAVIRSDAGAIVWVERVLQADMPFRWLLRSRSSEHGRPCASLVGLLNGIRAALGVERGGALRIARVPSDA